MYTGNFLEHRQQVAHALSVTRMPCCDDADPDVWAYAGILFALHGVGGFAGDYRADHPESLHAAETHALASSHPFLAFSCKAAIAGGPSSIARNFSCSVCTANDSAAAAAIGAASSKAKAAASCKKRWDGKGWDGKGWG